MSRTLLAASPGLSGQGVSNALWAFAILKLVCKMGFVWRMGSNPGLFGTLDCYVHLTSCLTWWVIKSSALHTRCEYSNLIAAASF